MRDAGVEASGQGIHNDQTGNSGLGGRLNVHVEHGHVDSRQPRADHRAHQLTAQHHPQNNGSNGEAFNPAVGFDQLRGR